MTYPSFKVFKREIYNKISEAEKNRLFYWSLFDPSSWEESELTASALPAYLPSMPRRKQSILGILKKSPRIKKTFIDTGKREEFFAKFANGEILTNYLLAAALSEHLRNKGISGYQPVDIEKQTFPDVHMRKGGRKNVYLEIKGIIEAENMNDVVVFHAGTKSMGSKIVTNGGRVLGISAIGNNLPEALQKTYEAVKVVNFTGRQFRKDIA